jgi:Holliday junction resolvasome RuvABC ATP-dependent DNA helicase subunit
MGDINSPYPAGELKAIVEAQAARLDVLLSPQAARIIAEHADGIPRRAEQLLASLRRHFPNAGATQLGVADVRLYLADAGYDPGASPEEDQG